MPPNQDKPAKGKSTDPRAVALKANMAKRKAQTQARRGGKAVGKSEPSAFDPPQASSQDKPERG